jgi:hypothetical protein
MRVNKHVPLTTEAKFAPIGLSDVVVAMGHLGWSTPRQDRYLVRRTAWYKYPIWLLGGPIVRAQMRHNERVRRYFQAVHWLEASIDTEGESRSLKLHGKASIRDARKINDICDAFQRGLRWLTKDGPLPEDLASADAMESRNGSSTGAQTPDSTNQPR